MTQNHSIYYIDINDDLYYFSNNTLQSNIFLNTDNLFIKLTNEKIKSVYLNDNATLVFIITMNNDIYLKGHNKEKIMINQSIQEIFTDFTLIPNIKGKYIDSYLNVKTTIVDINDNIWINTGSKYDILPNIKASKVEY